MEKLISMTDFVLEQFDLLYKAKISIETYVSRTKKYASFLNIKLELWMFVPCDLDGNILISIQDKEQYLRNCYDNGWWNQFVDYKVLYHHAKERCLFEGFEVYKYSKGLEIIYNKEKDIQVFAKQNENEFRLCSMHSTIEDLVKYKQTLTASALKQIGL